MALTQCLAILLFLVFSSLYLVTSALALALDSSVSLRRVEFKGLNFADRCPSFALVKRRQSIRSSQRPVAWDARADDTGFMAFGYDSS